MNKIGIALKRKLVIVSADDSQDNRRMVSLVNHQLMQLGYILSEEAFMELSKTDLANIVAFSKDAIEYFQSYLGDGSHKTLSNLILEGDLFDTHWSLLSHYWKNSEWGLTKEKNYDFEISKLKILNYADEKKFHSIFTSLVQANTAITPKDFETIEWFVDNYKPEELAMPNVIPFKENLCMLAAKGVDVPVRTATDVLRIAAYISGLGSDLILPPKKIQESGWSKKWIDNPEYKKAKFGPFKRPMRKHILSLLEKVANVAEMKTRQNRWLRLLHMLNPQDYTKQYPKAAKAAYLLRNQSTNKQLAKSDVKNGYTRNKRIVTWKGKLMATYKESFLGGLKMHKEHAGEMARSLDALLRNNIKYQTEILREFKAGAAKVSNKVLFELYTHFNKRFKPITNRTVFIPGARKPVELSDLPAMSVELVDDVLETIWEILFEKFKLLPDLGKVWLDENLKKIPLPTNMRILDDSMEIVIRGTRVSFGADVAMINAYIYWTASCDIDLSMTFLNPKPEGGDSEWHVVNGVKIPIKPTCSFNIMSPFPGVKHSGDIIPYRPGEYAEYIGIDIKKTVALGYRYGLMTAYNYEGGGLNVAGGIAGFQEVNVIEASKSWLPTNAIAATKLGSNASTTALILFDFVEKEWILVDIDLKQVPMSTGDEFTAYILGLAELLEVSAFTLLKLHAEARGSIVADAANADTTFEAKDFNKNYEDIVKFML